MAEIVPPSYESAGSYSGASDRMTLSALLTPNPAPGPFAPWAGVKPTNLDTGMQVTQLGTPAMFIQVNTGTAYVPAAITSNSGWICHNNGQRQVVIAAASATFARIDLIIAHVYDAVDDSGTLNTWQLEVVAGTPAASPAVPAVPTNAIVLAQLTVAANVSSISNAAITDLRTWEVALGGVLPVNGLAAVPAGYTGHYVHDRSTGRLAHNPAAGPAQPKLLPVAAVANMSVANINEGGTGEATALTVSIATDGNTDLEIYFKCGAAQATTGSSTFQVAFRVYLDATVIDSIISPIMQPDGSDHCGMAWTSFAAAFLGCRPSAGVHTIKVTFQEQFGTAGCALFGAANNPIVLRVKPVCL